MTKHWNWFNADALGLIRGRYWTVLQAVKVGDKAIKQMMQDELSIFKQDTRECIGEYPTLIGEIGCPYDMVSAQFGSTSYSGGDTRCGARCGAAFSAPPSGHWLHVDETCH